MWFPKTVNRHEIGLLSVFFFMNVQHPVQCSRQMRSPKWWIKLNVGTFPCLSRINLSHKFYSVFRIRNWDIYLSFL